MHWRWEKWHETIKAEFLDSDHNLCSPTFEGSKFLLKQNLNLISTMKTLLKSFNGSFLAIHRLTDLITVPLDIFKLVN